MTYSLLCYPKLYPSSKTRLYLQRSLSSTDRPCRTAAKQVLRLHELFGAQENRTQNSTMTPACYIDRCSAVLCFVSTAHLPSACSPVVVSRALPVLRHAHVRNPRRYFCMLANSSTSSLHGVISRLKCFGTRSRVQALMSQISRMKTLPHSCRPFSLCAPPPFKICEPMALQASHQPCHQNFHDAAYSPTSSLPLDSVSALLGCWINGMW